MFEDEKRWESIPSQKKPTKKTFKINTIALKLVYKLMDKDS